MRSLTAATIVMGLMILAGCFPPVTLNPIYTEEETVFEPDLVGVWSEEDSSDQFQFEQTGETAYDLTGSVDSGVVFSFGVRLTRLNGELFMDLYPDYYDVDIDDFYKLHLLPVHSFYRIELTTDTLRLFMIDEDWLSKFMESNADATPYEVLAERTVLTGTTGQLQAFVGQLMETEGAFEEAVTLLRVNEQ
jgi:hypothetical protein